MTSRHLVADGNLTLLRNINSDRFVYAGRKLIGIFTRENSHVDNYSGFTVTQAERCVAHFPCLFAEYRAEKSFLCRKLRFALRRNLADKYISGAHFRTVADNTVLIKILESLLAAVRNFACDFFRSELCVSGFDCVFFYMD